LSLAIREILAGKELSQKKVFSLSTVLKLCTTNIHENKAKVLETGRKCMIGAKNSSGINLEEVKDFMYLVCQIYGIGVKKDLE
jgi:thermostable 8-oxoguanine DNA glycosylase